MIQQPHNLPLPRRRHTVPGNLRMFPDKPEKRGLQSNNERQSQAAGCRDNSPTFFLALSRGSFQVALVLR